MSTEVAILFLGTGRGTVHSEIIVFCRLTRRVLNVRVPPKAAVETSLERTAACGTIRRPAEWRLCGRLTAGGHYRHGLHETLADAMISAEENSMSLINYLNRLNYRQ